MLSYLYLLFQGVSSFTGFPSNPCMIFLLGQFLSYDSKIYYVWIIFLFWRHQLNYLENIFFQNRNWYVFPDARIFNNGHLDIVAPFPKNNNLNISDSFLIMAKFLFVFCSWIISSSSLDISFLVGLIQVLETFLANYSTFLNLGFWSGLNKRPSQK